MDCNIFSYLFRFNWVVDNVSSNQKQRLMRRLLSRNLPPVRVRKSVFRFSMSAEPGIKWWDNSAAEQLVCQELLWFAQKFAAVCVRVRVCVYERERLCQCVGERDCVSVCVCVWERERENGCVCVCLRGLGDGRITNMAPGQLLSFSISDWIATLKRISLNFVKLYRLLI